MTRGQLDLGNHKLAGLYRKPAQRQPWRRARREKCPDETYRQLWGLVAGAVRDTFANHPEYLTPAGQRAAERSITKRVTGTLYGYAAQAARGRSMQTAKLAADVAADQIAFSATGRDQSTLLAKARWMLTRLGGSKGRGAYDVTPTNSKEPAIGH